jgi:hypothetical protein
MSERTSTPGDRSAPGAPSGKGRPALTRRQFLGRAAAAAGGVVAAPLVVPASALGLGGEPAPSDKIIMAGIGIGGRGSGDLGWMMGQKDIRFVAVCDIRKSQREQVKQMIDGHNGDKDCKTYRDLREFLAVRPDIDGVLIATGDRWHALASTLAMRAGKDVYSEKPSCMTIAEGQAVVEAAQRYGRIYQTGTQRLSEPNFIFANELLRLGRLGKIHTVRAHIAPWDAAEMRYDWMPEEPEPAGDEVDWDKWLGPCPWRPYNSSYVRGGWRGFYDFHTSCIGEWGAHTFAQCQAALDPATGTCPVEYDYIANPTGDNMETRFASGIKMMLHREGWWHGSCGVRYEGSEGWVSIADGYDKPEVSSPALLADFDKIVKEYIERTKNAPDHVRNLFDCIKTRRQAVANPLVMHRSMTAVHAANICMWLKRNMKFDPVKEEFIGDAEANRLRSRAMREPWIA